MATLWLALGILLGGFLTLGWAVLVFGVGDDDLSMPADRRARDERRDTFR